MSDWENVKQRADIVDVVSAYVPLQRAGRIFKAPCPFHNERTPSFIVTPERQTWHCFGSCNTGGDVFTFIERKENIPRVDAMKLLAERYGVELERRGPNPNEPKHARLLEANEAAALFFHNLLLTAPAGAEGRAYVERRGLDADTVRAFQLGYAPEGWDHLRTYLASQGFSIEEQVAAGLLSENDTRQYDRFRNRLMFPIRDERGRVIGFGGRVLDDGLPKYLNTPQTPLFDKSGTLYALDRAKDGIRAAGAAVVVEGYMDAIAAHQHGITNVVATLGTALTERHVGILKRYARRVTLAMDADAAGVEAALRGEELIRRATNNDPDTPMQAAVDWRGLVRVQAGAPVEVRVFTVPQGKDPDEAIRSDPKAFQALTEQAVPPFEFRLRHELARIDRSNPRERLELADRLLPLVAAVADRALQAQYLTRLSQAAVIPEAELAARLSGNGARPAERLTLREPARPRGRRHAPPEDAGDAPPAQPSTATPAPLSRPPPAAPRGELTVLHLLLTRPLLREAGLALDPDLFTDSDLRSLFLAWRDTGVDGLAEALDDNGRETQGRVLGQRLAPFDDTTAARALADMVARLEQRRLEDRSRLLAAAVRETGPEANMPDAAARAVATLTTGTAPGEGPETEVAVLFVQSMNLARERHSREAAMRLHAGPPP